MGWTEEGWKRVLRIQQANSSSSGRQAVTKRSKVCWACSICLPVSFMWLARRQSQRKNFSFFLISTITSPTHNITLFSNSYTPGLLTSTCIWDPCLKNMNNLFNFISDNNRNITLSLSFCLSPSLSHRHSYIVLV